MTSARSTWAKSICRISIATSAAIRSWVCAGSESSQSTMSPRFDQISGSPFAPTRVSLLIVVTFTPFQFCSQVLRDSHRAVGLVMRVGIDTLAIVVNEQYRDVGAKVLPRFAVCAIRVADLPALLRVPA